MTSPLRAWLREKGMSEAEAEARCARIGLAPVFRALLAGGQTLPTLALKIGRALGMDAESVRPLGHPLNARIWDPPDKKKDPSGLPTPRETDLDPHWYRKCGAYNVEHNALDKDALHRLVEEKGLDWLRFREVHKREIALASSARSKERTVRRHAQALADALGCEVEELLRDAGDIPIAPDPGTGEPSPGSIAGEVSVNMLEAVRHEKGMSLDEAGDRWAETDGTQREHKRHGRAAWNGLLYRLADAPRIREKEAQRLERALGVRRDRFLKG